MSKGYDPSFLGSTVPAIPLPSFSETLSEDVLERDTLSPDMDGRRIYRHYHNYTICMSKKHRTALFAALNVDQSLLQTTDKTKGWRQDDAVGSENQLNGDYYEGNVWDKGHLAPDAAAGWGATEEERIAATNDTYYYTNATLQHENFNRDEWKDLETSVRGWTDDATNKLSELTGPIFGTSHENTVKPGEREPAVIPAGFFKVIAYVKSDEKLQVKCFAMYQDAAHLEDRGGVVDHKRYQVPISEIEQLTGLVFDPVYHQANSVEVEDDTVSPSQGVFIKAAMVNPVGKDTGNEWISIHNSTDQTVNMDGWKLVDQKGRTLVLEKDGEYLIEAGLTITVQSISPLRLVNTAGTLTLQNEEGTQVDCASYTKDQVQEGVAVDLLKGR